MSVCASVSRTLTPEDVAVEIVLGRVNADGELIDFAVTPMQAAEQSGPSTYLFRSAIQPIARSGLYGYAIRVLPRHADSLTRFLPGLILWACGRAAVAAGQH